MDLKLSGKYAVVSGSTSGIGLAIATLLAAEGAMICINGRTKETVNIAIQHLLAKHPKPVVKGVVADLSTVEGCKILGEECGQADILVNNIGIYEPKPFEFIPDEDWDRFFQINVMSGVRLSRIALPAMKQRGFGRIIFISSESALNPPPEMVHYGMTKSAQLSISRALAESTQGSGVTVNCVLPGPTRTEGVKSFIKRLAKEQEISESQIEKNFFEKERPGSLLARFITPEEIANTVVYLCSPLSAATNGAAIRAEGGLVRNIS